MAYVETALYVDSAQYAAVAMWTASTAYTIGQIVRQRTVPAVNSERCFICTTAGTSLVTEPTWVLTRGSATTEAAGPRWHEVTGRPALNADKTNTNAWTASQGAIAVGMVIKNTTATHYFICTTAGTAGTGAEPTWNTTTGATTTDGTVTWMCLGAVGSFTAKFGAPCARLRLPLNNATTWLVNANMTVFVGDDHAEVNTVAGTQFFTAASVCRVICVDHTATLPAGSSDLRTSASILDSGGANLAFGSTTSPSIYVYGVKITLSFGGDIQICQGGARHKFENCLFSITHTGNGNVISFGDSTAGGTAIDFVDCEFHLNAPVTSQGLNARSGAIKWENCFISGTLTGCNPVFTGSPFANFIVEGCDLSNIPAGYALIGNIVGAAAPNSYFCFKDCKMPSSFLPYTTSDANIRETVTIDFVRCDNGPTNYKNERHMRTGGQTTSTSVVRTDGATDGTTAISHKIDVTANATFSGRFNALPLAVWNSTIGSSRNVTLYGMANDARVPNNDECWFDVEYLGQSGSPDGDFKRGSKSNVLAAASALTADTGSSWDVASAGASVRGNSTPYAFGAVISTASNPSKVFYCTTAGTTAAAEPSAVNLSTWNPDDKSSNVTLSGGNLVAVASSATVAAIRSGSAQTAGKFYFEVTSTGTITNSGVGIANITANLGTVHNTVVGAAFVNINNGVVFVNNTTGLGNVFGGVALVAGQATCIAVDLSIGKIWWRRAAGFWNDNGSANPTTGVGGLDISSVFPVGGSVPALALVTFSSSTLTHTANFGGTAFTHSVPSGFSAWIAAASSTVVYANAVDRSIIVDGTAVFTALANGTIRNNSFPYAAGSVFKVASNPGRVFICTGAGTSAASEPTSGSVGAAILSTTDKAANITLSGGNLTAGSSTATAGAVRSTVGQAIGKFYFEVLWNNGTNGCCGIVTGGQSLSTNFAPATPNALGWSTSVGAITLNGVTVVSGLSGITNGQTICWAIDLVNARAWARVNNGIWNNSSTANPVTNVGGIDILSLFPANAVFALFGNSTSTSPNATFNFGATAFTYTAPSGFSGGPTQLGYVSAVDGNVLADGAATFRTPARFKQTLTLSTPQPAQQGYLYVYPKFGRPSTSYFLDPRMVLS